MEYPVLRDRIHEEMRKALFDLAIISSQDFEAEVRDQAISSQIREGLIDPFAEEQAEIWEIRQQRVRGSPYRFLLRYQFALRII